MFSVSLTLFFHTTFFWSTWLPSHMNFLPIGRRQNETWNNHFNKSSERINCQAGIQYQDTWIDKSPLYWGSAARQINILLLINYLSGLPGKLNTFPHTDTFWRLCSRRPLKTLWQKEKLLILSNFSICHNAFNSIQ